MVERQQSKRWVRDYVFDILRSLDIRYIFGVPGTNEIPIIDGCSIKENGVTYIECLHENIAMGAAMGYARMTGKPGVVVLHVTPGAGHSLGNLFNAWKSKVPLVILCGQQHNELVTQEPLLASNLVQVVSQYTKWAHELRSPQETALVLQRAFKEAMAPPTGSVFISLPWDFTIQNIGLDDRIQGVTRIPHQFVGDLTAVQQAADILSQAKNPVIVAGDGVGYAQAWQELQTLAELLGAPVYLEGMSSMANFPNSDYHWQGELPGTQQGTQACFKDHDVAFLCGFGAQAQLTVFKYSDGQLIPNSVRQVYLHNNTWEIGKNHYGESAILGDIKATLPKLNELIEKKQQKGAVERNQHLRQLAEQRWGEWQYYLKQVQHKEGIRAVVVADALRELVSEYNLEQKFVYVHEAVSNPNPFQLLLPFSEPTSYYCVEGGSLGWSMPATLGIKLAEKHSECFSNTPELVVNVVGDGSALFYPQVWWTASKYQLPILYVILNNREYRTLLQGLQAVVKSYGDTESTEGNGWQPVSLEPDYLKIQNPNINFVHLAKAFGVCDGIQVRQAEKVKEALRKGFEFVRSKKQPFVVEVFADQTVKPDEPQPISVQTVEPPVNIYLATKLKSNDKAVDMELYQQIVM